MQISKTTLSKILFWRKVLIQGFVLTFFLFGFSAFSEQCPVKMTLNQRQECDLELLMNGAFSPLEGFMDQDAYDSVVDHMHLPDGSLWPIPIVLDVDEKMRGLISPGSDLQLHDTENRLLATLHVSDIWQPNKAHEAHKVYGTTDLKHPGVDYLFRFTQQYYVGGTLIPHNHPKHYDFTHLRKTPEELKKHFADQGITRIVGFQTRNPLHRAHVELTQRAAKQIDGHLLLHPVVGMTKPGDVDHFTRVKCYEKVIPYYSQSNATLSLLPLSMRMAGPREAVWHALIRKNYGCTHFIVGRDHAGPGKDSNGQDFYHPYAAQELALKYSSEIGLEIIPFKEVVYVAEDNNYQVYDEVSPEKTILSISGTRLREILNKGEEIPEWFSYPEVINVLRQTMPARLDQGFVIFFTGLSGAGKSTLANALAIKLMELQNRPITVLDGDVVRQQLSSELSFSKEHRSLNIQRIGFVAHQIAKNRGAAICAAIAPYDADRLHNRALISGQGNYIEVYVATPLEECEKRDVKGLYKLARQAKLPNFTGISDPFETPSQAEIILDTSTSTVSEDVDGIIEYLMNEGLIKFERVSNSQDCLTLRDD